MKYAVVTASTKGIGKSIGCKLLKEGYFVFFNYFSDDLNAETLSKEIADYKHFFSIIKANMASYEGIYDLVGEVNKVTNSIDCLVLNTGVTIRKSFEEITFDDWNYQMNTNLTFPFFLTQAFYNNFAHNSRIIFIGSLLGSVPHANSIPYAVSKAGINMLAKSLVKHFADKLVTVNVIAPGFVNTNWQIDKPQELRKKIEKKIALGRFAEADEIANICMCIINNTYINGAVISVDGGYSFQ